MPAELTTERLRLRALTADDLHDLHDRVFSDPDVELGYYLARPAWGRGLATELGRALMDMAFGDLGLTHIVAVVRPENTASQNVLAKIGFQRVGVQRHYGADVELWERSSPTE